MIEKVIRKVDKDRNEDIIIIFLKIKFIDSTRFVVSSNIVGNVAEGIKKN